jgi:hypothetical protein
LLQPRNFSTRPSKGPPSPSLTPCSRAHGAVKAPGNVPATVDAQVPAATEFYILPDNGLATTPEAKGIIHRVAQSRVVPVDPTTTRAVDVTPQ